jgi:hypothetical protein
MMVVLVLANAGKGVRVPRMPLGLLEKKADPTRLTLLGLLALY